MNAATISMLAIRAPALMNAAAACGAPVREHAPRAERRRAVSLRFLAVGASYDSG